MSIVITRHLPIIVALLASICPAQETRRQYLSGTSAADAVPWEFFCTANRNSGKWSTLPVPSHWEFHGFGNFNYGHDDPKKPFEQGQYKHKFKIEENLKNQRVFLVFDGVMTDADVRLNGQTAGPVHQGSFYRFKYEITKLVKFGQENLLEVTVSKHSANESVNRAERQSDFWIFGGIFRPVWLEFTPQQFIQRVAIDARADGTFAMDVHVNGQGNSHLIQLAINDAAGKTVGQATGKLDPAAQEQVVRVSTTVANPSLWNAETPNLYTAQASLVVAANARADVPGAANPAHRLSQKFGFRTVEVKPGDGIYINGKRIVMKGTCRHSFRPDSGRTLSRKDSQADVELMKQMNMNAVRMSHYPPDEHFLEVCDEKGLYVLDELTGWQKAYDTQVGRKLVAEMIARDVNHPSIILWCNGNEGGWNRDLDDDYAKLDIQKREVLHPWEKFRKTNTKHYPTYPQLQKLLEGDEIVMPTEFLHGLYDGGHGAGLADYWKLLGSHPKSAGGFLWVFADEGAKRTDGNFPNNIDVAGNLAPDGILGPYHEKEGSFYTIRKLWSPVKVTRDDDLAARALKIRLHNQYDFINLSTCTLEWKEVQCGIGPIGQVVRGPTRLQCPDAAPGASAVLSLPLTGSRGHLILVTVRDRAERELIVWAYPICLTTEPIEPLVNDAEPVKPANNTDSYDFSANNITARIDRKTGQLLALSRNSKSMPLTNGPRLASGQGDITAVESQKDGTIKLTGSGDLKSARWSMNAKGVLRLDFEYANEKPAPVLGITFDFPENDISSHRWLGQGPYRVWKNRMEGGHLSVHETAFNDTQTGYKGWIYPEFKGYFANWNWSRLATKHGNLLIASSTPGLFFRLGTPAQPDPKLLKKCTTTFPPGNLSFLHGIAPIGNKFHDAKDTGPQGQPHPPGGPYKATIYLTIEP